MEDLRNANEIIQLDICFKEELDKLQISPQNIIENFEEAIPPWTYQSADMDIEVF